MRKIFNTVIFSLIFSFTFSCKTEVKMDNETKIQNDKSELIEKETKSVNIIEYSLTEAIKALPLVDPTTVPDSFNVNIDSVEYLIDQSGNVKIKNLRIANDTSSFNLNLSEYFTIENIFIFPRDNYLFAFYTETDFDTGESFIAKINVEKSEIIWKVRGFGFNLGTPMILDSVAYIATIGTIGKINLDSGKVIWRQYDLYDSKKSAFNSFDEIEVKGENAIFISKNWKHKSMDSVIVNDKTGEIVKIVK